MASGIVQADGRLLLVRNNWQIGLIWSLPGGRVEPGEAMQDACVREVEEETGYRVRAGDLAYVIDAFNQELGLQFIYHVYPCTVIGGELRQPHGDEHALEARWVPTAEVGRYMTWTTYRDPLLEYLRGGHRTYHLKRDGGLKPENMAAGE